MVVAPMLAPAVGGIVTDLYGWRAIFVASGALGLLVALATLLGLPETGNRGVSGGGAGLAVMLQLLRLRRFRGYALQSAFSMSLFFSFLAGAPYFTIEVLGEPARTYGLAFMAVSASFMAGNGVTAQLSPRFGLDRMILLGSSLACAALCCSVLWMLLAGWSLFALFLPMSLVAFAQGLAMPNAQAGAVSVDPRAAGAASGLAGFLQMAAAASCAQLVGTLPQGTPWPMMAVMLACGAGMVWASLSGYPARCIGEPRRTAFPAYAKTSAIGEKHLGDHVMRRKMSFAHIVVRS
jgi:DHA1 family bicyclomycin/chloramphenicol resistance-like MFS transporter